MGGMTFCLSNHRNKENIYETKLFVWDVGKQPYERYEPPGVWNVSLVSEDA